MKTTLIKGRELARYLKIRELVEKYPNDMELGGKVRELFWEKEHHLNIDTAGYPVKKINSYLTTDLKDNNV